MKKAWMFVPAAAFAATLAHAGTYAVLQESDCPAISAGDLQREVSKAGTLTGLDLPKGMALRTEVRCAREGRHARYVYTVRAAIEKQVADGDVLRWAPVAQLTGYGTATGSSALLRQVGFTVRDVIRQEP